MCGNALTPAGSDLATQGGPLVLRSLPGDQQWALLVLLIGGLLGFFGLFLGWSLSANVWGYLYAAFRYEEEPWWIGVIALGAITGVVATILNVVAAVRRRALPSSSRVLLGGILTALCPIGAHIGVVSTDATPVGRDAGYFWDLFWLLESPGLWVSLAGGVLVISAIAVGRILPLRKS